VTRASTSSILEAESDRRRKRRRSVTAPGYHPLVPPQSRAPARGTQYALRRAA
jgi:hypothetical protein